MQRFVIGAGIIAVAIIIFVVVALIASSSGDSDEGQDDQAIASRTAEASPQPTTIPSPTATPSPEEQARNLTLVPVDDFVQFTTDPDTISPETQGVFYIDVETGQVDGMYGLIDGTFFYAFSGEGRFTVFQRRESRFRDGVTYQPGQYLADRETHTVYRWEGDAELVLQQGIFSSSEIASRGPLALFRVPGRAEDDWFTLLNVETGEVIATFQAQGRWGLISEDVSKIAIGGSDVYVVDVATGQVNHVAEKVLGFPRDAGSVDLIETSDGFFLSANPGDSRVDGGFWIRYAWDGTMLAQGEGTQVFPSPEGDFVAVADPIAQASLDATGWWVMNAVDTRSGESQFRVVGVSPWYGFHTGNRWLANNSGFVVS